MYKVCDQIISMLVFSHMAGLHLPSATARHMITSHDCLHQIPIMFNEH